MSYEFTNRIMAIIFTAFVLVLSIILFFWGWFENSGRESSGVVLLFSLPLLMQFGGLLYLCLRPVTGERSAAFFYLFWGTMLLCAALNYGLWIKYLHFASPQKTEIPNEASAQMLSYLSLGGITSLLLVVVIVTLAFMTPEDRQGRFRHFLGSIKRGAARRPFWTLLQSMAVFLTVAYLFGFAFAFHDLTVPRAVPEPTPAPAQAVPKETQGAAANDLQPSPVARPKQQLPPLYMASLPNNDKGGPPPDLQEAGAPACAKFLFAEPSARFERFGLGDKTDPEQKKTEENLPFKDEEKAKRMAANRDAMERAVQRICNISKHRQQAHVLLLGHASDKSYKSGPYSNNYFLSEARALNVLHELKSEVAARNNGEWTNVEYEAIPLSSAEFPQARTFMQKVCQPEKGEDPKMVYAYITPVKNHPLGIARALYDEDAYTRLSLLDHLYFAMYTVTTTGYGDITPTTNYAKLLTCLANICEVFFIVGFFNSLMALKGDDNKGGDNGRKGGHVSAPAAAGGQRG